METKLLRCKLQGEIKRVSHLSFGNPDETLLSAGSLRSIVQTQLWDLETATVIRTGSEKGVTLRRSGPPRHSFHIVPDAVWVVGRNADAGYTTPQPRPNGGVALIPDRNAFISGNSSREEGLKVWDLKPLLDVSDAAISGERPASDFFSFPGVKPTSRLKGPQVSVWKQAGGEVILTIVYLSHGSIPCLFRPMGNWWRRDHSETMTWWYGTSWATCLS